jgi:hypothetical protein
MCALERVKCKYWNGRRYSAVPNATHSSHVGDKSAPFNASNRAGASMPFHLRMETEQFPKRSYSTQGNGQSLEIRWLILFCFSGFYLFIYLFIYLLILFSSMSLDGILTEKINADSSRRHLCLSYLNFEIELWNGHGPDCYSLYGEKEKKKGEITLLFFENEHVILGKTCSGKQRAVGISRNICRDTCLSAVRDTKTGYDLSKCQVDSWVFTEN